MLYVNVTCSTYKAVVTLYRRYSVTQARNIPIWSGCVGMLFLAVGIIEHDWAVGMSGYYEGGEVASEVASEVAR